MAANKQRSYRILTWVFAFATLVWLIGALVSGSYLKFGFIGILNGLVAYVCWQMSQAA